MLFYHYLLFFFFFFNDTATTEIYTRPYTLSLHDALPISRPSLAPNRSPRNTRSAAAGNTPPARGSAGRASWHRTAGTALPRTRRSGSPPAIGSSVDRRDDSHPWVAPCAAPTAPLVLLGPCAFP